MATATYSKTRKTKSSSTGKSTNIPKELTKWATEEMKLHTVMQNAQNPFQLPSEEEFKFLCHGKLLDVWNYVVQHTKSVQKAKHIQGNVKLKRSFGNKHKASGIESANSLALEEEREKQKILQQQKLRLTQELQQMKVDMGQLQRELGHAAEDLLNTENSCQSTCQGVRNIQRKENLLVVASCHAVQASTRYAEYTDRVNKCVSVITNKKSDSQDTCMETDGEELETESCHMVRQACENINSFLFHSLDNASDTSLLEAKKTQLLEKVDRAAAINSTHSLLSALAANAERDAAKLRRETKAIDISKDAAEISFSYSSKEGLKDMSCAPSATETVRDLLNASSEEQVLLWIKAEEHLNEEWKLSSRQTETISELDKLLTKLISAHPSHLVAAKNYVCARIQLAEERAVNPCLHKEIASLRERIDSAFRDRQVLKMKHSQIQDFQKLVAKKQTVIGKLARLNANAPERLKSHREQVLSYLESRSLVIHLTEVQALSVNLKGALISEMDQFLHLHLPCLLTVALDSFKRSCVLDLSISSDVYATALEGNQTYVDVCKALEFPGYKCVDCLPLHVLNIHSSLRELDATREQQTLQEKAVMKAAGITDNFDNFIVKQDQRVRDLHKRAEESDKAQCAKLLPLLKELAELIKLDSKHVDRWRTGVKSWWEQPAQWTTPWVRVRNHTFAQWMQLWRTAMTHTNTEMVSKDKSVKR